MEFIQEHGGITEEISKLTGGKQIIDFSSNLNPFGPPESVYRALKQTDFMNYPGNTNEVKLYLSELIQTDPQNVILANGAAEAFYFLMSFFRPKKVGILRPSFSEYEKAAISFGSKIVSIDNDSDDNFQLNIENVRELLNDCELLFLASPNNPDGQTVELSDIKEILRTAKTKDTKVIIDEAFVDFAGRERYTAIKLVEKYENLIIAGSLTKIFSIAGLRFGYIAANKKLMQRMEAARPPWPVSSVTLAAVKEALNDKEYLDSSIRKIRESRIDFGDALSRLGLAVIPSHANYLLVKLPEGYSSTGLTLKMIKEGILIRDCKSFGLGDRYIRLAVKLPEQNRLLIEKLAYHMQQSGLPATLLALL